MPKCQVRIRRTPTRALLCFATLYAASSLVRALDPAKPPGGNFDLSHWKLTLPDALASELSPVLLIAGVTTDTFFTGADGAMVFSCPVTGGTTVGSSYPRCELRELFDPFDDNVNWTGYGTHVLKAQCRVMQLPSTRKTIIGQIHSYTGKPLIKLQFNGDKIEALVKNSPNSDGDTRFLFATVGLGDLIDYQIKVVDGLLSMTVNGVNQSQYVFESEPAWTNQTFFFKAGNYCQDNSGPTNEAAIVSFYDLGVVHSAPLNTPPVLTNPAVNADGYFGFSVLGQGGTNLTIQTSTDLATWTDLLTTNSIAGALDFADTTAPIAPYRFYRVKRDP